MKKWIYYTRRKTSLRGRTYDSAKAYMNQVYLPLTQGVIYLCEELIRQNDKHPEDFRIEVSHSDVVQEEVQAQVDEIDQIITTLEKMNEFLPLFNIQIFAYKRMKDRLLQKIADLYTFNSTSKSNYSTAMEFAESVLKGLSKIQDGKGFNKASGTFNMDGMDMGWVKDLSDTHYTRRAEEEFGDYIAKDPDNLEKAVEVLKYEDAHEDDAEKVSEFLEPLEEQDVMEIKYLMYTAEEPYRTISMKYLDRFDIRKTDSSGIFKSSKDSIDFDIESDRDNDRGDYYTFFHEVFHAADYYHGIDNGYDDFYSDFYTGDTGQVLNDFMESDVENHMRQELTKELEDKDISHSEEQSMIKNVTDNLMIQDDNFDKLSPEEQELNKTMQDHYAKILDGPNHNTASDVYGGVTNFVISGNYGHQNKDGTPSEYWFEDAVGGADGVRNRYPNREGIAEYFGRIMTNKAEVGVESIDEFLPSSKGFMDEIFDTIVE